MRLLLIEDETELSRSICQYLERDNFICDASYSYRDAMERIEDYNYECILPDITLPGGNGLNILRRLKEQGKSDAVLIISARDSLNDKLNGLNLGADDYLTKPFHLPELSARIAAILRRKLFEGQIRIVTDDFTLDLHEKMVRGKKGYIDLTRKEYDLLLYFTANKNKVVTKEAIVEHLWGDHIDMNDNYDFIYTHIKNLRKKLVQSSCRDYIKAVYGMGYKFNLEPEENTIEKE